MGLASPDFKSSLCGNLVVNHYCEENKKKYYILIQPFVESTFFSGSSDELNLALKSLSLLEEMKIQLNGSKSISPYLDWDPLKIIRNLKTKITKNNKFDQFVNSNFENIENLAESLTETINELSRPVESVFHYDLHPHNLLFSKDKSICVIDLESFTNIHPKLTTAFGLFKLGRKSISKQSLSIENFKAMALENGFDLTSLKAFVQVELIRRTLFILDLHYVQNNDLWDEDIYKQAIGLDEVKALFN